MKLSSALVISAAFSLSTLATDHATAQNKQAEKFRVLVTNDNGIDDPKIVALARAFSKHVETWVVAPDQDQSGTGSRLTFMRGGKLEAKKRDIGDGIRAYSVSGTPGDCVVLAGAVLMTDNPPDLIVSGINGGANMGMEWMFSGTVGAVRVAALGGVPAIAVSGLDDDLPGAVDAAVDWVVRLSKSKIVKDLRPGDYLTVSMPRVTPDKIRGIKVVDRAPSMPTPRFKSTGESTWQFVGLETPDDPPPPNSDRAVVQAGFIAVVPMRLNEVDVARVAQWQREKLQLPPWRQETPAGK